MGTHFRTNLLQPSLAFLLRNAGFANITSFPLKGTIPISALIRKHHSKTRLLMLITSNSDYGKGKLSHDHTIHAVLGCSAVCAKNVEFVI